MRKNLDDFMKIQAVINVDDAIADQSYPASGSFIDVSEFTHFAFLVHAGDNWGTPVFTVQAATAADGTPATVTGATRTGLATDDDKWFTIEVETAVLEALGSTYRYVTLTVSSSSSEEADIFFLGWNARREPVSQPTNYVEAVVVAG